MDHQCRFKNSETKCPPAGFFFFFKSKVKHLCGHEKKQICNMLAMPENTDNHTHTHKSHDTASSSIITKTNATQTTLPSRSVQGHPIKPIPDHVSSTLSHYHPTRDSYGERLSTNLDQKNITLIRKKRQVILQFKKLL